MSLKLRKQLEPNNKFRSPSIFTKSVSFDFSTFIESFGLGQDLLSPFTGYADLSRQCFILAIGILLSGAGPTVSNTE